MQSEQIVRNHLVGADPELFLMRNNKIISAEGLIGGTKDNPKKISNEGHAIQEDNVMVEYNIPPVDSAENFIKEHQFVLDYLKVTASLLDNAELNFSASAELDPMYLDTPQAMQFGCEPDYNVWLREINNAPRSETNLRTCGGHIHIGYENPTQEVSEKIVKAMDAILGVQSIILDKDERRKEMYGKAGAFRFKSYGVEYRTLSNFWIASPQLMKWAFDSSMKAIELVNSGIIDRIDDLYAEEIQEIINKNKKVKAKELIETIDDLVFQNLKIKKQ